jgi:hypothetical protein
MGLKADTRGKLNGELLVVYFSKIPKLSKMDSHKVKIYEFLYNFLSI